MTFKRFLNKEYESDRKYKVYLINKNILENYEKILHGENIKGIIKNHQRFIVKMDLKSKYKNKHHTLQVLEQYANTNDKNIALNNLTNYMCNKHLFSTLKK